MIALCPACVAAIGGACAGPDADWRPAGPDEPCQAYDCPERPMTTTELNEMTPAELNAVYADPDFETVPVFVYGTLRAGFGNSRLIDDFRFVRVPATAPGLRMFSLHGGFPACIVDSTAVAPVIGELVWFHRDDVASAMAALDRLEGYRGLGRPRHYDRVRTVASYDVAGESYSADPWVYVYDAGQAYGDEITDFAAWRAED